MRVAVYGGSFNPPHVGHAMVAAWLLWTERADRVWLVPTYAHPFAKRLLPFEGRRQMCEALAGVVDARVEVCPIESELPAPSYTIDTLQALQRAHPEHEFRLVVGADVLADVNKWKAWDVIRDRFPPHVVGRLGYPDVPGAVCFPEVSSTEIRRRRAAAESFDHLVPAPVARLYLELTADS